MKKLFSKKLVKYLSALLFAGGAVALFLAIDGPHKVTTARCRAGAIISKSNELVIGADNDADFKAKNTGALPVNPPSTAVGPNLTPNGDLETFDPSDSGQAPVGWDHYTSGENSGTFSLVPGHNSATAVRTTVANFKSGSSDWFYKPVTLTPGGYYQFNDYYRSNAPSLAVMQFTDASGHNTFINLPRVPAAANWTQYAAKFFVPDGTVTGVVYHTLPNNGTLDVDDVQLRYAKAQGFTQPMVSVTFDDGWRSIHDNALPILKKFQIPSTQYIISGYLNVPSYMTTQDAYDFQESGSEIGSHTVDHKDLVTLDRNQIKYELRTSEKQLSACFEQVRDFAPPYGSFNDTTQSIMKQTYQTSRGTDTGYNTADNLSPFALVVQDVSPTTTSDQIQAWLKTAKKNNAWLILVYHQIDVSGSPYSRTPAQLKEDLYLIKQSKIQALTVRQAYNLASQQAVH